MKRPRSVPILLALAAFPALAATPVGRFVLVEQRYQKGAANLAFADRPVTLEVIREGAGLDARIGSGSDGAGVHRWPAFVSDAGSLPVEVLERDLDGPDGTIHARYRVRPSAEDDLILEIDERYALTADGRALEGTMRVEFRGGSTDRGGFTLRRRFVREP